MELYGSLMDRCNLTMKPKAGKARLVGCFVLLYGVSWVSWVVLSRCFFYREEHHQLGEKAGSLSENPGKSCHGFTLES